MKVFRMIFLLVFIGGNCTFAASRAAPPTSSDGFTLEPALSYYSGVLSQEGVAEIGTQVLGLEARIGYKMSAFTLGLSYLIGVGTGEQFDKKGDIKPTDLGLYLKYDLPENFNIFGSSLFSSKTKIQSSENPADFSGQGFKLGFAYSGLSMCSVMIEMTSHNYTKYDNADLAKPIKDTSTGVSLNFPLR